MSKGPVRMTDNQKLLLATQFAYKQKYLNTFDNSNQHNTVNYVCSKGTDSNGNFRYSDDVANNWEVVESRDHDGPGETGFYGSMVKVKDEFGNDTDQNIIVFRGSNDNDFINNPGDAIEEWWRNNAALLNSTTPTPQQNDAARFVVEMMRKHDGYFALDGHSLGGQLAFYVAIYIAENHPDLLDRITEVCNLDGPGFSDEFIELHRDAINRLNNRGLLEHWQWSVVGDLLFSPVPRGNENRKIIELKNNDIEGFDRHTDEVKIVNGKVVTTDTKDPMAQKWGQASRVVDTLGLSKEEVAGGLIIGGLGLGGLGILALSFMGPTGFVLFLGGLAWACGKFDVVGGIKNVCSSIYNGIKNYIKKKREKKLDGDYKINYSAINEIAEKYSSLSQGLTNLAAESEDIVLSYWEEIFKSTNSYVLKSLANGCFASTRACANSLKSASDSFYEVMRIYRNGDQEVSSSYYNYNVAHSSES